MHRLALVGAAALFAFSLPSYPAAAPIPYRASIDDVCKRPPTEGVSETTGGDAHLDVGTRVGPVGHADAGLGGNGSRSKYTGATKESTALLWHDYLACRSNYDSRRVASLPAPTKKASFNHPAKIRTHLGSLPKPTPGEARASTPAAPLNPASSKAATIENNVSCNGPGATVGMKTGAATIRVPMQGQPGPTIRNTVTALPGCTGTVTGWEINGGFNMDRN